MKFEDATLYIAITGSTVNAAITLFKIARIKQEEPLYKIYKEILFQRLLLWILIIPIVLDKVNVFLWK